MLRDLINFCGFVREYRRRGFTLRNSIRSARALVYPTIS